MAHFNNVGIILEIFVFSHLNISLIIASGAIRCYCSARNLIILAIKYAEKKKKRALYLNASFALGLQKQFPHH